MTDDLHLMEDNFPIVDFRSQNRQMVEQKAKQIMKDDPIIRELMAHTLWVKWILDKAYGRNTEVSELEKGWAFSFYSTSYPLLSIKDYETLVAKFEDHTTNELEKYLKAHSKVNRS